jgi:hypothetical protein
VALSSPLHGRILTPTPSHIVFGRRQICTQCESWRANRCGLGHFLASNAACPRNKFLAMTQPSNPTCKTGCDDKTPLKAMTWSEAVASFYKDMDTWKKSGYKTVPSITHDSRFSICQACPKYRHFQCEICKCVALAKTKLATTQCPEGKW